MSFCLQKWIKAFIFANVEVYKMIFLYGKNIQWNIKIK